MHVNTLVAVNLYFDVVQPRNEDKNLVMYDLAFHLVLENDGSRPLDLDYLRNKYKMEINSKVVYQRMTSLLQSDGRNV